MYRSQMALDKNIGTAGINEMKNFWNNNKL